MKLIKEETIFKPEEIKNLRDVANKYWETVKSKKYGQGEIFVSPDAKPLEISDGGISSYFAEMATRYNPDVIKGLKAVLQFILDNKKYHIVINNDTCTAYN